MLDITRPLLEASKHLRGGRRYRLISHHELETLETFYQALSADDRRCRFGGAMSDAAVRDYCEGICWGDTSVIVRSGPYCIEGTATIARIDESRVEIALAWPRFVNSEVIVRPLLHLALVSARSMHGADEAIIDLDLADPCVLQCARENSHVTIQDNLLRVNLDELIIEDDWLQDS